MSDEMQIIDIIDHRDAYGVQSMVVLNRYPRCLFEQDGRWLTGHDEFVFCFYRREVVNGPSHWKAFGGREFDIQMIDGSVEKANGQWWDKTHPEYAELTYPIGINTIDELEKCYVFMGGFHIDRQIVDEWRRNNEPSNNYNKYRKTHEDYGRQQIVSRWGEVGV